MSSLLFDSSIFLAYNIILMKNPRSCYVNAPSKINLHLRIKEKRPDGFHELESIFSALNFGDSIHFEVLNKEGSWDLSIESWEDIDLTGNKNLISQAVALFRSKTGFGRGLYCHLNKRIPLASGLGGGSSDAAAALIALNCLSGIKIPLEEILSMAAILGSDVPFFLDGGAAWVTGRGECIEPLAYIGNFGILLVKAPFQSQTKEAYRLLDDYREKEKVFSSSFPADDLKKALINPPQNWPFFNDFLPLLPEADAYKEIIDNLYKAGALFSSLSGSGSTCFAVFPDIKKAQAAEKTIKNKEFFTQVTFFLASKAKPVLK